MTSLAADVDAKPALAKQDGRTFWSAIPGGGIVITQAGTDPRVSREGLCLGVRAEVGDPGHRWPKPGPPDEGGRAIPSRPRRGNMYMDPKCFVTPPSPSPPPPASR